MVSQLSDLLKPFTYAAQKKKNDPILIFSFIQTAHYFSNEIYKLHIRCLVRGSNNIRETLWAWGSNRRDRS